MGANVRIRRRKNWRTPYRRWKPVSSVREYRGMQSLCAGGQERQRTAGVKGCGSPPTDAKRRRAHWRVEGGSPIGSRTKCLGGVRAASLIGSRVKRLAQGKLMPASTCTGYYLTQNFAGLAALPPSPARNIFAGRRKNV